MEIINTYDETLAHYNMKLNHAEEELDDALRSVKELGLLAAAGWMGPAASSFGERVEDLTREMREPKQGIDQVRQALAQLRMTIEDEIRALMEEEAAAARAAEAAAAIAAGETYLNG